MDDKRMSEIWKPLTRDTYKDWVATIISEASDRLSDWEIKFINDMEFILSSSRNLSQGQAEKLDELYARYTK